jgi:heat shock protein HtpX
MAKMSMGVQVIEQPRNETEQWLVSTVRKQAEAAGIGMPEVGVFDSPDPNAFATGANRNHALVAVSTGLLHNMRKDEVEAVLGHEVSHVANGDMVTLTLIQGVLNTFVFFLSRVVGYIVDRAVFRTERGVGPGFYITMFACQILFGIAASAIVAWFSRRREFRADAGSAGLLHSPRPMIAALTRLGQMQTGGLPDAVKAFGIDSRSGLANLFATHPPIEQRIAALQAPQ